MKTSVLILTLNEEANLGRCLAALEWCDDIVVLDSFSSDRTVEIARAAGTRVLARKFTNFADQRNFALQTVEFRHPWVFHLDADEVVTEELREEIERLDGGALFDAYRIAGRLMVGERWLRYSGMYPVYQVRLARAKGFLFEQIGHGQRESRGVQRVGTLRQPYLHYALSKGLADWFDRHNRYSSDEADYVLRKVSRTRAPLTDFFSGDPVARRRALKRYSYGLPFRPWLRFFYVFVLRRGFMDGLAGYRYAQMLAMYERLIDLKIVERRGSMISLPFTDVESSIDSVSPRGPLS